MQLIKLNTGIKGIKIVQLNCLIAQFVDNTQLFAQNQESVEEVIRTLSLLEKNTGLHVNYDKSSIHCSGNLSLSFSVNH